MTISSLTEKLNYDGIIELATFAQDNVIAVDTESGETKGMLGISLGFRMPFGVIAEYLPVRHGEGNDLDEHQLKELYNVFSTSTLVFHNAAYDLGVLESNGYTHVGRFYDTMLMEHWLNENIAHFGSYSLDACSRRHGGDPKNRPIEMQIIIDELGWDTVPLDLMTIYSANDAEITYELWEKLIGKFRDEGFDGEIWHRHECDFVNTMRRMVKRGVRIDPEFCVREKFRGESILLDCIKEVGFNPGSTTELGKLLFDVLGLPVLKRSAKTNKPSFDAKVMTKYDEMLESRSDPVARTVLRFRGWQKVISTNYTAYLKMADAHYRVHSNYKLHGTVTGRMSSERPNLQNIPKAGKKDWNGTLEKAFIPEDGFRLWKCDYSQLEFRLAAAYAEDEQLIAVFSDEHRDIFDEMSKTLGWVRDRVKTLTYATLFGGGATHIGEVFGIGTDRARELINDYYDSYPGLRQVIKAADKLARRRGYAKYWTGRRRHFQFPRDESHKAFNALIQGGAFEIVKRRMNALDQTVCDEECRMVLQIHDCVVFEIATGKEDYYLPLIKKTMEAVEEDYDFGVPFKVSVTEWGVKNVEE